MKKSVDSNTTLSRFVCSILLLLLFSGSFAQNGSRITGQVRSAADGPLPYASVALKGTTRGGMTDEGGRFSIAVPPGSYTLIVTHTGYVSFERQVQVKANESLHVGIITLNVSTEVLNEIVVDGMISKFSKKQSEEVARMPLKNLENPQVYTVVPKELLTEQVAVDFRSALLTSPGVSNVTLGVGSGGTGLSMYLRGFSGANGAGAIRNGMATNFVSLSDPANLESLEIIKGPSSTLFGTTLVSYGGLVNRITKKAFDHKGTEVSFSTGSDGLGRVAVDYNTPLNEDKSFLFRLNTAIQREKSFQDYGKNKTFLFAPTFTYQVDDRLTLDLDVEYFQSDRTTSYVQITSAAGIDNIDELNWDFSKSYTSNELLSSSKVTNVFGKATYILSEQWTSETGISYSNTENDANYLFLVVSNTDSIIRKIMNIPSNFNTTQIQQNFTGKFPVLGMNNRVLIGLDYTQLQTTDTRATISQFDKVPLNGDNVNLNVYKYEEDLAGVARSQNKRDTKTYSAYASDVLNITGRLVTMASLRVDHFRDDISDYDQTSLSPKMGIVYQIVKDQVSAFGNFMDGFKNVAPRVTEERPDDPVSFKPEHASQLEGGLKMELLGGKLNGTLSYYHIKVRNRVRSVTGDDGNSYSVQDGIQRSNGFEADLISNPVQGMHIILGYGYNDSRYTKADASIDGKRPYAVPDHVGNFWVSQKLTSGKMQGLGVGIGGNFASSHYYDSANTIKVPGFSKFDATAFFEKKQVRIGLKMNNISDKEYWISDYYAEPQAARSFLANVTFRF